MPDTLIRGWRQSEQFSGNYNDYTVQGYKYTSPSNEIDWQITFWPNFHGPIHTVWLSSGNFYKFGVHPTESILEGKPIEIIDEAVDISERTNRH